MDDFTLDDFEVELDEDDEETCIVTLTGENGEKVTVLIDRDLAEDLTLKISQVLGLDESSDDDD